MTRHGEWRMAEVMRHGGAAGRVERAVMWTDTLGPGPRFGRWAQVLVASGRLGYVYKPCPQFLGCTTTRRRPR